MNRQSRRKMKQMKTIENTNGRKAVKRLLLPLLLVLVVVFVAGCVSESEVQAYLAEHPVATPVPEETQSAGETGGEATGELATSGEQGEEDISPDPLGTQPGETGVQEEEDKGLLARLFGMFDSRSESIQIVALLTVLSLAPSILMMFTSFVRIVMVLSFTRNALGLQNMPPNQVIIGLALFLSFFVMSPVIQEIKTEAVIPYVAEAIDLEEATERGVVPIKNFMLRQTRQTDLEMFYSFSDEAMPENIEETKLEILTPAFLTSELRRAFEIGFFIYIPFIVIDMIVASTLMAMGMMMLPPVTISLPFKVLLFVVVDGWALTIGSLLSSFG